MEKFEPLDKSEALAELEDYWRNCNRCPLSKTRMNNPILGMGPNNADIFLVGSSPGVDEERQGLSFVGEAGDLIDRACFILGMERDMLWVTNTVACRPPDFSKPERTRDPGSEEIGACRPRLWDEIYAIDPILIVTLGSVATKNLCGPQIQVSKHRGHIYDVKIPSRYRNTITYPAMTTWHPSSVMKKLDIRQGEDWPIITKKDLLCPSPDNSFAQFMSDIYHAMEAVAYTKALHEGTALPPFIQELASYRP